MRFVDVRLDVAGTLREAWTLARRDRDVLFGVAGVFLFVPQLAQALLVALPPQWPKAGADQTAWTAWLDAVSAWGARNDPLLILLVLVSVFGTLTLFRLYADRARPDVATALRLGLTLFPRYLILALAISVPVNLGIVLLLLPGLYLKGRLFVAGPAFVAEQPAGTVAAWRRSFALTRGHGAVLMVLACVPLLAGNILALPFEAAAQAFDSAPLANPVTAALLDIGSSAVRTLCVVAAILLEIVVYRRLSSGT